MWFESFFKFYKNSYIFTEIAAFAKGNKKLFELSYGINIIRCSLWIYSVGCYIIILDK